MRTIFRLVVPRTMESSMSTTRWPSSSTAHGIQLQAHAKIANGLLGFDERAPDVMIANQAHAKRNAGLAA